MINPFGFNNFSSIIPIPSLQGSYHSTGNLLGPNSASLTLNSNLIHHNPMEIILGICRGKC